MSHSWFRPKLYGFGFTPSSWEGWAATAIYVGGLLASFRLVPAHVVDRRLGLLVAAMLALVLTVAFMLLAARKTKGDMRWRWGRD